jgi:hypothetical protein
MTWLAKFDIQLSHLSATRVTPARGGHRGRRPCVTQRPKARTGRISPTVDNVHGSAKPTEGDPRPKRPTGTTAQASIRRRATFLSLRISAAVVSIKTTNRETSGPELYGPSALDVGAHGTQAIRRLFGQTGDFSVLQMNVSGQKVKSLNSPVQSVLMGPRTPLH